MSVTCFVFPTPGVQFDRDWRLGRVFFRAAGRLNDDAVKRSSQCSVCPSWAAAHQVSSQVARRSPGAATVAVESETTEGEPGATVSDLDQEIAKGRRAARNDEAWEQ